MAINMIMRPDAGCTPHTLHMCWYNGWASTRWFEYVRKPLPDGRWIIYRHPNKYKLKKYPNFPKSEPVAILERIPDDVL